MNQCSLFHGEMYFGGLDCCSPFDIRVATSSDLIILCLVSVRIGVNPGGGEVAGSMTYYILKCTEV